MSRIVVVGSLNIDLVVQTPRMPQPGETIKGESFHVIPGGKGANQAVAAARQGAQVTMIGSVGADDFGLRQKQCLDQDGIDLAYLTIDPQRSTGVALITVDETGQNSIVIVPGANGTITPAQIDAAQAAICNADMLICQLEIPLDAVTRAVDLAHAHNVPVILNPAPAYPLERSLFEKITYLIPNETEAGLLTGLAVNELYPAREAAAQLQRLGVQTVILTLGADGVLIADGNNVTHEAAVPVKAVDTTAAGDAFVGSFAVAVTEGQSVIEAVRRAKHAAALAVTKFGAQSSLPTRAEVEAFIAQHTA